MSDKLRGTLKSVNTAEGFGFIHCNGKDYFVHGSEFKEKPFKTLREGISVLFKATQGAKGLRAKDVELV